jgi:hypothetical protein
MILPTVVFSQQPVHMSKGGDLPERVLSFFAPFVIPKIFQDVHVLREYVRGEEFATLRVLHGDLTAVDRIFEKSLEITWSNCYEALLISTFAVMNHRNFGLDLPLIGDLFWIPLTSEFPDEFNDRLRNLPGRLYPDSPGGDVKDKDKLQHFFGSAFVQFVSESHQGAERVGDMVEFGEGQFIVGGHFDERDRRANQQGRAFGLALLTGRDVLPSDFLSLVLAESQLPDPGGRASGNWCGHENPERVWEER